jgi:hypothetical protein
MAPKTSNQWPLLAVFVEIGSQSVGVPRRQAAVGLPVGAGMDWWSWWRLI